jgi:NAD(P)-dependent dehydrogenase (short-subunit alcohol dehydrogenase family)
VRLDQATVVVTGAASGLGLATARRLVAEGARVVLVDLPGSAGADEAKALGPAATFAPADITSPDEMAAVFDTARGLGPVRGLVHCAGRNSDRIRILAKDGTPGPLDIFADVIRINLVGTYNALRLAAAAIAESEPIDGERGACVLTASVAAFEGQIGQTSYSAAKAGVHAMTLVAARDLASRQIRVNTIAPGVFDTAMLAKLRDDLRGALAASVPHPRRLGDPAEYADLAVHLLTNPYLNGETIRLDGAIRMAPR